MNVYFFGLCFCLLSVITVSHANEAANEAILETVAVGAAAIEEKDTVPTNDESNSQTPSSDVVLINRSDLNAWMSQQQIQANVITNQANNQLWTTLVLAFVWLITFVMLLHFMRQQGTRDYISVIGLNLIIFATVFMVLVVETDQQLTAGAGILGAIAGYLFRAMQNEQLSNEQQSNEAQKT